MRSNNSLLLYIPELQVNCHSCCMQDAFSVSMSDVHNCSCKWCIAKGTLSLRFMLRV